MVIDIIGYYGHNFGDLLMLQGILNHLPNDCVKVNILSYDKLNIGDLNLSCNAEVHSFYIRMPIPKLIKLFREADSIIWGGGSCFNDVDGSGGIRQMLLAKLVNPSIRIEYQGVGIDLKKNRHNKFCLKMALFLSSSFSVRDHKSYDIVKKHSCTKLIDDPIYLNNDWLKKIKSNIHERRLIISYRCIDKYFPQNKKNYLESFCRNIESLIATGGYNDVYIVNADSRVDNQNNSYIASRLETLNLPVLNFVQQRPLEEICSLISSSSLVITGRLHLAAIASLYNIPYILLNYSEKNRQFALLHNNISSLVEYKELQYDNRLRDLLYLINKDNSDD